MPRGIADHVHINHGVDGLDLILHPEGANKFAPVQAVRVAPPRMLLLHRTTPARACVLSDGPIACAIPEHPRRRGAAVVGSDKADFGHVLRVVVISKNDDARRIAGYFRITLTMRRLPMGVSASKRSLGARQCRPCQFFAEHGAEAFRLGGPGRPGAQLDDALQVIVGALPVERRLGLRVRPLRLVPLRPSANHRQRE